MANTIRCVAMRHIHSCGSHGSSGFLARSGHHGRVHHHRILPVSSQSSRRTFFWHGEVEDRRIRDIVCHPDSIGSKILPGNLVVKYFPRSKKNREVPTELAHGYFWMIQDLKATENKPILSNPYLIPAKNAQSFPTLKGFQTLKDDLVDLPHFFLRKNRSMDEQAQCTLVAIAFREYGFNLLKSWTEPFETAFQDKDRAEVVHVNITEGWFATNLLQSIIRGQTKQRTPIEQHDRTLIGFCNDAEQFRDSLRMHNLLSGYVFLLDGLGRVRFAGSGEATEEEVSNLIQYAHDLTPLLDKKRKTTRKERSSKQRRK